MKLRAVAVGISVALGVLAMSLGADAQPRKVYRVGVIHAGGPYYEVVEGLRDGLKELGFEDGKQFVLDIRGTKGDLNAVEQAARSLEREKVDLIYTLPTSVTAAAKRATAHTPIVFCAGTDPVALGLVESFAKPGGRLTGIHFLTTDLTAKRLEILKEILPKLRRVVTFYDPNNRSTMEAIKSAREAARILKVELMERQVTSVEALRAGLQALKPGEADAYFWVSGVMVTSQAQLIIDAARTKRLPTMFQDGSLVAKGALASYGVNYHEVGRLSAKHVQRILTGTNPKDLPVENMDRLELVLNLRTARELGITIPQVLLLRADQVFQ